MLFILSLWQIIIAPLEGCLLAEYIETANLGTVVHVHEDDGASATDADAAYPSVETGQFVGYERGVCGVEPGQLDEGLGFEIHCSC